MKNKLMALLLVSAMTITMLTGCGGAGSNENTESVSGKTDNNTEAETTEAASGEKTSVIVGIQADPGSLDPYYTQSTGSLAVWPTVFEYMVHMDGMGGKAQPTAVKSYGLTSEKEDEFVWDLELFEGITDGDGREFTADDAIWSINKYVESGFYANGEYIVSAEKVDDYHLTLTLNANTIGLIDIILAGIPVVVQETYESHDDYSKKPVTTSPYEVISYTPGSSIELARKDEYWQKDESMVCTSSKTNVDNITFKVIADANQMDIALENQEVDMIPAVNSTDLGDFLNDDLTAKEGYTSGSYLRGATLTLFFNCDESNPFHNEDLRKACAYSIDTSAIVENVLSGQGVALSTVGSECFGDYNGNWSSAEYYGRDGADMDKAQEYMEKSGFDTGRSIKIITETDNNIIRVAQIVQSYLMQLGLDVTIESYETALYEDMCTDPSAWDIFIGYRGSGDYLANMWRWTFDQDIRGGFTCNFARDEELQGYLKACIDPDSHTAEDMDKFHECLKEHCYAYGIYAQTVYVMGNENVTDFVYTDAWNLLPGACTYTWN